MKKTKLPNLVLMLALAAGMCILLPTLNAQQDSPAAQQRQPDTASQTSTMNQASDPQTFSGKVAKAGGKYILKDTANQTMYVLDDQDKAKQFEGQEVKVSGTLDAQTKTIHVSSITPGS
jgi:uncharacterized protein DUF5818